jgi:membrane-associated phospholipid phosphatase
MKSQKVIEIFAKTIGGVLSAASWVFYMFMYIFFKGSIVFKGDLQMELYTYVLFLAFPLVAILSLSQLGLIENIDTRNKKQRMLMSAVFVLSSAVLLFIAYAKGFEDLGKLIIVFLLPAIVIGLVNKYWLMSMHTASNAISVTTMAYLSGISYYPLYICVFLVAWSRVYEGKHTIAQVLAGGIFGILVSLIILNLFFPLNYLA